MDKNTTARQNKAREVLTKLGAITDPVDVPWSCTSPGNIISKAHKEAHKLRQQLNEEFESSTAETYKVKTHRSRKLQTPDPDMPDLDLLHGAGSSVGAKAPPPPAPLVVQARRTRRSSLPSTLFHAQLPAANTLVAETTVEDTCSPGATRPMRLNSYEWQGTHHGVPSQLLSSGQVQLPTGLEAYTQGNELSAVARVSAAGSSCSQMVRFSTSEGQLLLPDLSEVTDALLGSEAPLSAPASPSVAAAASTRQQPAASASTSTPASLTRHACQDDNELQNAPLIVSEPASPKPSGRSSTTSIPTPMFANCLSSFSAPVQGSSPATANGSSSAVTKRSGGGGGAASSSVSSLTARPSMAAGMAALSSRASVAATASSPTTHRAPAVLQALHDELSDLFPGSPCGKSTAKSSGNLSAAAAAVAGYGSPASSEGKLRFSGMLTSGIIGSLMGVTSSKAATTEADFEVARSSKSCFNFGTPTATPSPSPTAGSAAARHKGAIKRKPSRFMLAAAAGSAASHPHSMIDSMDSGDFSVELSSASCSYAPLSPTKQQQGLPAALSLAISTQLPHRSSGGCSEPGAEAPLSLGAFPAADRLMSILHDGTDSKGPGGGPRKHPHHHGRRAAAGHHGDQQHAPPHKAASGVGRSSEDLAHSHAAAGVGTAAPSKATTAGSIVHKPPCRAESVCSLPAINSKH